MRKLLYFFILLIINLGCKNEIKKAEISLSESIQNNESEQQEETLKEFYLVFYGVDEIPNEKLKEKYL